MLKTDYIDIYQFHNPSFCPRPGGEDGLYDAALEAKKQGKIRYISLSNHRLSVAHEAIAVSYTHLDVYKRQEDGRNPDCPVCGAEGAHLHDCALYEDAHEPEAEDEEPFEEEEPEEEEEPSEEDPSCLLYTSRRSALMQAMSSRMSNGFVR